MTPCTSIVAATRRSCDGIDEVLMSLKTLARIEINGSANSRFDHGAFDPKTRRVFVANTGLDRVEVIDYDAARHLTTLQGFPEAAGVVADEGDVLVTNRGAAGLAWLDADSLETRLVAPTAPRPNGVAIASRSWLALVACIGNEAHGSELQSMILGKSQRWWLALPGQPRWCVTDRAGARVFLAIREPSMILVAQLPELHGVQHWRLPSGGAHGMDIDHQNGVLYVACDGRSLVALDVLAGDLRGQWSLAGAPDATFFNPASGLVHVAIADPGLVQSIDPSTGGSAEVKTAIGAKTTALVPPDRLYVFSPAHGGVVVLGEEPSDGLIAANVRDP
jgi:DNA-binding beta-propeller fold protein YncE